LAYIVEELSLFNKTKENKKMDEKRINFIKNNGDKLLNILDLNNFKSQREIVTFIKENDIKKIKNINKVNKLIQLGREIGLIEKNEFYEVVGSL